MIHAALLCSMSTARLSVGSSIIQGGGKRRAESMEQLLGTVAVQRQNALRATARGGAGLLRAVGLPTPQLRASVLS